MPVRKWLFYALLSPPVRVPAVKLHPGNGTWCTALWPRCWRGHEPPEQGCEPNHVQMQQVTGPGCPVPDQTLAATTHFVLWE